MKNLTLLIVAMLLCHSISMAQNSAQNSSAGNLEIVNAAGGDATAEEGSVAYSLGTTFYITLETSTATIAPGAQQAETEEVPDVVEEEEEPVVEEPATDPEEEPTQEEEPVTEEPTQPEDPVTEPAEEEQTPEAEPRGRTNPRGRSRKKNPNEPEAASGAEEEPNAKALKKSQFDIG